MADFNGLLNGASFTEEQFKQLNEHLATRGYLRGFALIKLFKLSIPFLGFFHRLTIVMFLVF